jgi:hypothetical protein
MKKILSVIGIAFLFVVLMNTSASAQCKSFAKRICKLDLFPYIHDGNYDASNILTEGEEADLYKTFFSGQEYRMVVCASEPLPPIEFKVIDANRNVVYDNREHNMAKIWDFKLESSQQLRIVLKVPVSKKKASEGDIISGCVSVLIGIKDPGSSTQTK